VGEPLSGWREEKCRVGGDAALAYSGTMKMKLYFFPIAPNPTKVRLHIAEKVAAGAPLEVGESFAEIDRWQRAYLDRPAIQGVINVGLDG